MAAAKGTTNWFAIIITAVVVLALVGVGTLVIIVNNKATDPGEAPEASIVDPESGAIEFGTGADVVDTYVDFMCPACATFEDQWGGQLQQAALDDEITLRVHPVAILNRFSQGTDFSTRAGNAFYCVASDNEAAALPFFNSMFANQPSENTPGLSDDQLISLASDAGADGAASCITEGTYSKFVDAHTGELPAGPDGRSATPTIVVNGDYVAPNDRQTVLSKLLAK
ncbi:DsbA family protein [Microbacterium sp. YY-01]|uniref:DsbA family protein n=1 Tax=Microbacterium sp. YY-01 TaxID=3421634 RepID=UPI003D17F475